MFLVYLSAIGTYPVPTDVFSLSDLFSHVINMLLKLYMYVHVRSSLSKFDLNFKEMYSSSSTFYLGRWSRVRIFCGLVRFRAVGNVDNILLLLFTLWEAVGLPRDEKHTHAHKKILRPLYLCFVYFCISCSTVETKLTCKCLRQYIISHFGFISHTLLP